MSNSAGKSIAGRIARVAGDDGVSQETWMIHWKVSRVVCMCMDWVDLADLVWLGLAWG